MHRQSIILLLIVIVCITASAWADQYDHEDARRLREAGDIVSLESIINTAKSHHPGRIIEVELENKQNTLVYEVEIVDDKGVVWELYFNAQNGQLLEHKKDD